MKLAWLRRALLMLSTGRTWSPRAGVGGSVATARAAPAAKAGAGRPVPRAGHRYGREVCDTIAAIAVATPLYALWLHIQLSSRYTAGFRLRDPFGIVARGVQPGYWLNVLAAALTSSVIAYVQIALVAWLAQRWLAAELTALGDKAAGGAAADFEGVVRVAETSFLSLPSLGVLSTCVGGLARGAMPPAELRALVLGPSAVGLIGLLAAVFIRHRCRSKAGERRGRS